MRKMSDAALKILKERYFLKNDKGEIIEDWDGLCARVSKYIASVEEDEKLWENEFNYVLYNRLFLPNTPTLMNAGKENMGSLHACVSGETLVVTEVGLKRMDNISVGDMVLTHKGRFRKVNKLYSNGKKETIGVFRGDNKKRKSANAFLTEDHKILDENSNWVKIKDAINPMYPFINEQSPISKYNLSLFTDRGMVVNSNIKPINRKNSVGIPNIIENDLDLAWLIGFYIAEGNISKNEILRFTINKKEKDFEEKIYKIIYEKTGLHCNTQQSNHGNWMTVTCGSVILCDFMKNLIGYGFSSKKIPWTVFGESAEYKKELLNGINDGDGCSINNGETKLVLANQTVIYQCAMIHRSIGNHVSYKANYSSKLQRTPTSLISTVKLPTTGITKIGRTVQDVYDIEVEEDHSFVAGDLICHNCFVYPIEDSMGSRDSIDGISDSWKAAALIGKEGGGIGYSFSNLRPKGDFISTSKGTSSGPVSFMKVNDAVAEAVKQGGTRRIAQMGILSVHHPDILEFIKCKNEEGQIKNFNISVAITDKFMEAVRKDKDYELINPSNKKVVAKIPAKDIWDEIVAGAWLNGEPGVVFIDTINEHHNLKKVGEIQSTNPCCCPEWIDLYTKEYGFIKIHKVIGKEVSIWNGHEWSSVIPYHAGVVSRLMNITVDYGNNQVKTIDCTEDHRFYMSDCSFKTAKELVVGDNLFPQIVNENKEIISTTVSVSLIGYHYSSHNYSPTINVYCVTEPKNGTACFNGIITGNSEQPLLPMEACVLGSVDVGKLIDSDKQFNWKELDHIVSIGTRFLDNTVTLSKAPIKEINETVANNRKIGLGIMGFADCLIQLGITYGSDESFKFAERLAKRIKEVAHETSVMLGKQKGLPLNSKFYENTTPGTPDLEGTPRNACQISYAPTGCQRGDTLIVSNNGILRLDEIGNKIGNQWQDIDIDVSQEYGYKKASKFFINGNAKTKKIKMSSGAELECTLNHKYRVLTDAYEWKQASELKQGDKIVLSLGTYNKTTEIVFKKITKDHFNENDIIQPDKSSPILAKFLGIYYGDGSNHDKGIRIACNAKETEYLKIVQMSKDIFGIEPTLENNGRNCISVCLNSQQLLRWLEINNLKKGKSVDIEVPMLVRQFSRDSLVQFVNGFFFADGSLGKNNKYFDTASTKFAKQMLVIIRAIGLDCSIQNHISGKGSFINRVLFNSRRRTCHAKHSFTLQEEGFYNCVVDDIVEIEDSECETFDIEVLDRNTYLANGYVSHNTIASIADASFGIEPLYDVCFIKNILDGKRIFFVSDIVAQHLKELGYEKAVKEIESGKTLDEIDIPLKIKKLFATTYKLTPEQHVKMQAAFQKYCDSAISKTCNLPNSATKQDVADTYFMAYDLGCKGITVYRDGSRQLQVVETGKGKEKSKIVKRPDIVQGVTYKIPTSFGKLYMTINKEGDTPIEVFFMMADISNDMSSLLSALGRTLSVSLKHGTPLKDIIKTLKKIKVGTVVYYNGKAFKSVPQLIAGVLEEIFMGKESPATLISACDKCGAQLIIQEGCEKCSNPDCGYTKCG